MSLPKKPFDDLLVGDKLVHQDGDTAIVLEGGAGEDAVYVENEDGSTAAYLYRADYEREWRAAEAED